MAKADRLARSDERRIELEADYETLLVTALQQTAAKRLMLFGHQQERIAAAKAAPIVAEITTLGMRSTACGTSLRSHHLRCIRNFSHRAGQ